MILSELELSFLYFCGFVYLSPEIAYQQQEDSAKKIGVVPPYFCTCLCVRVFVYMSVSLCICLCICLYFCVFVYLSICLCICPYDKDFLQHECGAKRV